MVVISVLALLMKKCVMKCYKSGHIALHGRPHLQNQFHFIQIVLENRSCISVCRRRVCEPDPEAQYRTDCRHTALTKQSFVVGRGGLAQMVERSLSM